MKKNRNPFEEGYIIMMLLTNFSNLAALIAALKNLILYSFTYKRHYLAIIVKNNSRYQLSFFSHVNLLT